MTSLNAFELVLYTYVGQLRVSRSNVYWVGGPFALCGRIRFRVDDDDDLLTTHREAWDTHAHLLRTTLRLMGGRVASQRPCSSLVLPPYLGLGQVMGGLFLRSVLQFSNDGLSLNTGYICVRENTTLEPSEIDIIASLLLTNCDIWYEQVVATEAYYVA